MYRSSPKIKNWRKVQIQVFILPLYLSWVSLELEAAVIGVLYKEKNDDFPSKQIHFFGGKREKF